ncbi:phage tail tape measure protein [Actinoplanes sp. Pm04-4]|uniref:Phage tail tape measure protein n=1 Tax=Paractinoplanes pyxinae TaxID=2997416 RepID=A0ABT4B6C0_9ACTN|nr:phage tail tape measure protein [Actinoplanes pyxinae]MCY1141385.1 phage tail tape measure protein [Actinoplanes pyxinae]
MALKLGELTAYLKADDGAFRKGLAKSKDDFKRFGSGIAAAGPAVGAAAGIALAAGLTSALSVDKAKAKLAAQLGGDAQYAKAMGDIAGRVYAQGFGESAEAVGDSLRAVLSAGLLPEDAADADIERITVKAQALSDVFGQDVVASARAAGQMVRTGLAGSADEAFDILTRGFQQSGDHAGDLLDTFSEYSTQFRKLGIDGTTATGLLNQGLKAGARDADTVADALKELSIRAIDGSKASSQAYEALGLDAKKMTAQMAKGGPEASAGLQLILDRLRGMKDPAAQSAAAVGLFGTKAEDLGSALFSLDLDTAAQSMGDVKGAADKMTNSLGQSASQQLEAFKRQAQAALVEKMAAAVPYIQQVVGFLQQHSAIIGPLAVGLGIFAGVVMTIIGVMKVWTAVQTALNIVQMASPTTWIILGILALIAVIVLIATKTRWFQNIWAAVWGFMKGVGAWFAGPFAGFFVTLWNKITSSLSRAKAQLMNGINMIKGFFVSWYQRSNEAMGKIISKGVSLVNWFRGLPGRIGGALRNVFSGLWSGFKTVVNRIIAGWNNLSFTVGGGSFAGVSLPSVTVSTPNIPYLAKGGIVQATPGGRLAVIGEGREDEAVLPLSKLRGLMAARARSVLELRSSGSRIDDLLLEILRIAIKNRGGNVQVALGTGRG